MQSALPSAATIGHVSSKIPRPEVSVWTSASRTAVLLTPEDGECGGYETAVFLFSTSKLFNKKCLDMMHIRCLQRIVHAKNINIYKYQTDNELPIIHSMYNCK